MQSHVTSSLDDEPEPHHLPTPLSSPNTNAPSWSITKDVFLARYHYHPSLYNDTPQHQWNVLPQFLILSGISPSSSLSSQQTHNTTLPSSNLGHTKRRLPPMTTTLNQQLALEPWIVHPPPNLSPQQQRRGAHSVASRPRLLFQYKPYCMQEPIKLSEKEISTVLEAAFGKENTQPIPLLPSPAPSPLSLRSPSPLPHNLGIKTGNLNAASHVAAVILIKLTLDLYLQAGPAQSYPLTVYMLEKAFIQGDVESRCKVFDFLVNVAVHGELLYIMPGNEGLEETLEDARYGEKDDVGASYQSEDWPSSITSAMNATATTQHNDNDTTTWPSLPQLSPTLHKKMDARSVKFQQWLRHILFRMLRTLCTLDEHSNAAAWSAAFSCLISLSSYDGLVARPYIDEIPLQAVYMLLKVSINESWPRALQCWLSTLAVNLLYTNGGDCIPAERSSSHGNAWRLCRLDPGRLEDFGGIHAVVCMYRAAPTYRVQRAFFSVMYDYYRGGVGAAHSGSVGGNGSNNNNSDDNDRFSVIGNAFLNMRVAEVLHAILFSTTGTVGGGNKRSSSGDTNNSSDAGGTTSNDAPYINTKNTNKDISQTTTTTTTTTTLTDVEASLLNISSMVYNELHTHAPAIEISKECIATCLMEMHAMVLRGLVKDRVDEGSSSRSLDDLFEITFRSALLPYEAPPPPPGDADASVLAEREDAWNTLQRLLLLSTSSLSASDPTQTSSISQAKDSVTKGNSETTDHGHTSDNTARLWLQSLFLSIYTTNKNKENAACFLPTLTSQTYLHKLLYKVFSSASCTAMTSMVFVDAVCGALDTLRVQIGATTMQQNSEAAATPTTLLADFIDVLDRAIDWLSIENRSLSPASLSMTPGGVFHQKAMVAIAEYSVSLVVVRQFDDIKSLPYTNNAGPGTATTASPMRDQQQTLLVHGTPALPAVRTWSIDHQSHDEERSSVAVYRSPSFQHGSTTTTSIAGGGAQSTSGMQHGRSTTTTTTTNNNPHEQQQQQSVIGVSSPTAVSTPTATTTTTNTSTTAKGMQRPLSPLTRIVPVPKIAAAWRRLTGPHSPPSVPSTTRSVSVPGQDQKKNNNNNNSSSALAGTDQDQQHQQPGSMNSMSQQPLSAGIAAIGSDFGPVARYETTSMHRGSMHGKDMFQSLNTTTPHTAPAAATEEESKKNKRNTAPPHYHHALSLLERAQQYQSNEDRHRHRRQQLKSDIIADAEYSLTAVHSYLIGLSGVSSRHFAAVPPVFLKKIFDGLHPQDILSVEGGAMGDAFSHMNGGRKESTRVAMERVHAVHAGRSCCDARAAIAALLLQRYSLFIMNDTSHDPSSSGFHSNTNANNSGTTLNALLDSQSISNLIMDADIRVRYHASLYALQRVAQKYPQKYRQALRGIVAKAQRGEDEQLLCSPEAQLQMMMEMRFVTVDMLV